MIAPNPKTPPPPILKQDPDKPIAVEILASDIQAIAEAARRIRNSRLTRKALVALIHDQSHIGKRDIEIVLNNLENLDHDWLKPVIGVPKG